MQTYGRKGIPHFSCLLRAIFLLIGLPSLLLAAIGYQGLSGRAEFSNNRLGTATVIDVRDAGASCPYYVLRFTADNGEQVTFETQLCSDVQVGQIIQVMDDPQNPLLAPTVMDLSQSGW